MELQLELHRVLLEILLFIRSYRKVSTPKTHLTSFCPRAVPGTTKLEGSWSAGDFPSVFCFLEFNIRILKDEAASDRNSKDKFSALPIV